MTKRTRKYRPAPAEFASASDALNHIIGGGHVYHRHKFQHNGWACSWSINFVRSNYRRMRIAILNQPKP